MARIDSYTAITPTVDDYLLGTDSPSGGGPTRNFTVQSIIDLTSTAVGNTNDYLSNITVEAGYAADPADTATITFDVGSQSDVTLNLGGAAFKAATHYATSSDLSTHINNTNQPHSLDSIVGTGSITTTKLSGNPGTGTAGQVLLSNGAGGFSWGTDQDDNDNYYLSSVTRPNGSSSDVLFTITGGTPVTATIFGEGAFMSKADIRTDIENNTSFEASDFTFLGDLATKDLVDTVDIKQNSIDATKIKDNIITEDKLKIINDPVDGYVLTADGTNGNMEWVENSASNYYLNGVSRGGDNNRTLTFDVLGVSSDPTYTFGDGAFALFAGSGDNFGSGDTVARGDHNHAIGDLQNAGALASKDTAGTNEIANKAITAGKLSPAVAGVDGQVLSINSSSELIWLNASGTVIPDARILPATVGNTNADTNDGLGGQVLRVNSAGTGVEYINLSVEKNEINAGGAAAGKILGIDANGDMQWVGLPSVDIGADSITAAKINFIDDDLSAATAGHILVSNGTDFSNVAISGDATITSTGVVTITGHPNISAATSSNNNGYTFIQDITLDSNGHVTGIGTAGISTANTISNGSTTIPTSNAVYDHVQTTISNTAISNIQGGAVSPTEISFIDDQLSASTAGDILVSNGTNFDNVTMGGDAIINSSGNVDLVLNNLPQYSGDLHSTTRIAIAHYDPNIAFFNDASRSRYMTLSDLWDLAADDDGDASLDVDVYQTTPVPFQSARTWKGLKIRDNGIRYKHLGLEFTTRDANVTLASGSASKDIDFDSKAVYEVTLPTDNTATTLNFDSADIGMTKVVLIKTQSSAYTGTLTFSQTSGTGTFVRLSSDDIVKDANTTNYVQITCIAKSASDCTYIYTVGTAQ